MDIKREIDGYLIVKHLTKLDAGEVFSLHFEERLLPGTLTSFAKSRYIHGDKTWTVAWEVGTQELIAEPETLPVFASLRNSFTNDLMQADGT